MFPPLMFTVATPETCKNPPFPGFGAAPPASLAFISISLVVRVPSIISIPPPARFAVLFDTEVPIPETVTSPALLIIPPPEPDVPVAVLLKIVVPPSTLSVPPLLKIPPPPVVGAAPCASFPVIAVPVTFITPPPFQSPPPSIAVLLVTEPPIIVTIGVPETCSPPPFPGLAVAIKFPSNVSALKVYATPPLISIPPPARLAEFPEIETVSMFRVPPKVRIPPPEPSTPEAVFPLSEVDPFSVSIAPLL